VWPGSATHTRQQAELFLFLFYFIYFISPTATLLGRQLHHHLPVAEVAPHGRSPLAAGGQSARRSWLMGRLSAQRWWGWFSGCCRTGWHEEIGELSFPTTLVLNELFSLGVTAEPLREKINRKSAISLQRGHLHSKFQVEGVAPHQSFLYGIVRLMNAS